LIFVDLDFALIARLERDFEAKVIVVVAEAVEIAEAETEEVPEEVKVFVEVFVEVEPAVNLVWKGCH
jgi:hypothetical protein